MKSKITQELVYKDRIYHIDIDAFYEIENNLPEDVSIGSIAWCDGDDSKEVTIGDRIFTVYKPLENYTDPIDGIITVVDRHMCGLTRNVRDLIVTDCSFKTDNYEIKTDKFLFSFEKSTRTLELVEVSKVEVVIVKKINMIGVSMTKSHIYSHMRSKFTVNSDSLIVEDTIYCKITKFKLEN